MINISFKALAELMVHHGHMYIVEFGEDFGDHRVYRFVVSKEYPTTTNYVTFGKGYEDEIKKDRDRVSAKGGRVLLQYDAVNDGIIGCSLDIHKIILELKKRSMNKQVDQWLERTNKVEETPAFTMPD